MHCIPEWKLKLHVWEIRELAASAMRELEGIGLAGPLKRQAQLWQAEGDRLVEAVQALLSKKQPPRRPRKK